MRSTRLVALALCAGLPHIVLAQGWLVPRPCIMETWPERPPIERPAPPVRDCGQAITRSRSDVRVELVDRVLRYEVEERFVNNGPIVGEADYLFPLPAGAAFQDLRLTIDGELVAGETMNAGEARRVYEDIVRRRRDPALVEWMGHGLLRARIFPINPGEEKRVVVRFQSVAQREGDVLRIDYFRATPPGANQPGMRLSDRAATSFSLSYRAGSELGTAYSPTHEVESSDRDGMRRVAVRGDARDVTVLVPVRRNGSASIALLPHAPGNENGFALITLTPPAEQRGEPTPRDVTLVLDVSGSMQGRKIEQARAAGRQLLATLSSRDRFRLIDFSTDVRTFRDDFVYATDANVREASRYLDQLEAVGSTNIQAALAEAMRSPIRPGRLPLVLFVTDGEPTVGERSPDRLAAMAKRNDDERDARRIFTFGLGSDVNVTLLEQLAIDGRGTAQFVRPDESVERMVGVVASRLVDPVVTGVRVRVEGGVRLSRMMPSQAADVFAGRDLVVLARYEGHGPARVIVEGMQRGVPVRWESNVDFPERQRDNPFVARLWATQRVGLLSADRRERGGNPELDEEMRTLGERYGIPTELTSYLVLEPGMDPRRLGAAMGAANGAVPSPNAPVAMRQMSFEAAKTAADQRAATSLSVLDASIAGNGRGVDRNGAVATRQVDGRTFRLQDSSWTDVRYRTTTKTVTVKPYSKVYFDLLARLPELRAVFALGDRIVVVGHTDAIRLDATGASELTAAEIDRLVKGW